MKCLFETGWGRNHFMTIILKQELLNDEKGI